ncbi:uncharacterized protein A4U43_C09F8170 [Asparagus officinalis]|uniref:Uncharacterized protein n=1 Tax=Asparagus officinalis TaxID=4686 RepID=A0A5P1E9D4_ASPOF|nr:uncharacterized protein A4U43_C09F8170 [Asparagus officinalis]
MKNTFYFVKSEMRRLQGDYIEGETMGPSFVMGGKLDMPGNEMVSDEEDDESDSVVLFRLVLAISLSFVAASCSVKCPFGKRRRWASLRPTSMEPYQVKNRKSLFHQKGKKSSQPMDMKSDTPTKENAVAKVALEENDAVKTDKNGKVTTEEDAQSASEPQLRKRKTSLHI